MAARGSVKALSVAHEEFIAKLYGGERSKSSGGADNDQGDVRAPFELIECKLTGGPGRVPKDKHKKPKMVREFEKIAYEAISEGREPALALRYYDPDSDFANLEGWVDFTLRLSTSDAFRSSMINRLMENDGD